MKDGFVLGIFVWGLRPGTLTLSLAYLEQDEEAAVEFLRRWFLGPIALTVPNEQMADLFGRMLERMGTARGAYLEEFFRSPLGRFLSSEPLQQGAWARIAGMGPYELGAWNKARALG